MTYQIEEIRGLRAVTTKSELHKLKFKNIDAMPHTRDIRYQHALYAELSYSLPPDKQL